MPTMRHAVTALTLVLLAPAATLLAGPLDPPPGPIASTAKPLAEVEPRIAVNAVNTPGNATCVFVISAPGSYYLTGNIIGVAGKGGIEITASNVILDLAGFSLAGVPGSFNGIDLVADAPTGIEVRDGIVRNWGGDGIDFSGSGFTSSTVRNVRACANSGYGIRGGNNNLITGCTASENFETGIFANLGSTIIACAADHNQHHGFGASTACSILDCSSSFNADHGFTVGSGGAISRCVAYGNVGAGIDAVTGVSISSNTARFNSEDGIRATIACLITGNNCVNNGQADGAGIHVTGGDNRIEGNNCSTQDRGIDVDVAGNFIVRNTCSGNTVNWSMVANNVFGPIINRSAPASAAVNGDAAASSLGSTDANANYTY